MLEALQLETIRNLHWAIAFSIATGVLNLISIGISLVAAKNMRKATRLWREAADNLNRSASARTPTKPAPR